MTVTADAGLAAAGERLEACVGGGGGNTADEEPLALSDGHVGLSLAETWEGGEVGRGVTSDGRPAEGKSALAGVSDLDEGATVSGKTPWLCHRGTFSIQH